MGDVLHKFHLKMMASLATSCPEVEGDKSCSMYSDEEEGSYHYQQIQKLRKRAKEMIKAINNSKLN